MASQPPTQEPKYPSAAYVGSTQGTGGVLASPIKLLSGTVVYVTIVFIASTIGYVIAGWPLSDAAYMVLLTIYSVGYGEVRPIDTTFLRVWTTMTIVLGCTGMIVLTGALVQVFTLFQFRRLLGLDRMQTEIERLDTHAIVCGFGRIGVQLAKALTDARHPFLIIERDPGKADEARAAGFLTLVGEATHEETLKAAGIERARVLATVLPDDAANVFITLSARNLNPKVQIIARGEAPSTESKLFHAGADKVVLPTHIGAERITELILFPATESVLGDTLEIGAVKRNLNDFGLDLEVVTAGERGALTGLTVGEAERRGNGAFFIVQIDREGGQSIQHPGEDVRIEAGDLILLVVRGSRLSAGAIFNAPQRPVRHGRMFIG
ncbi:TrkA-N [Novosphingobium nitrogenifigens DSM 19370]|uniref:TrkA-N n=1 Tax=Novosphingobium nitrogenifigens DSM 19370 TaxID=983920 RepID=F1Z8B7_9SPHN|nr:potassium channel protein [Novosphingobium nitrogenifigens]EGD59108.1 TrkA-N [Novosphingobium nitrogenifigens DSM 19370]